MILRDLFLKQRSHWGFLRLTLAVTTLTGTAIAQPAPGVEAPTAPTSAATAPTTEATAPTTEATASPPASATPDKEAVQEAGKHYARGLSLYSDGEYALAVIEFDRAYALVSDFRVLYNIGQVRVQLTNYAKARRALERYLSDGGDKVAPERRQAVAADLEMLAARTATLRVETNVAGAIITLDDVPIGTSPLSDPLLLDAGDHRLSVQKAGFSRAESRLTLAGGDATSTRLDLVPEARAAAPRIIVEKQYLEKSDRKPWIWATWSATGVFAISGATVGALGLKAANDLDNLRQSTQTNRGQLDSTQRRARALLVTGDVLGAAAIVSGGIALYLTLANREESGKATAKRDDHAHVELALGNNWLGLKGSY